MKLLFYIQESWTWKKNIMNFNFKYIYNVTGLSTFLFVVKQFKKMGYDNVHFGNGM